MKRVKKVIAILLSFVLMLSVYTPYASAQTNMTNDDYTFNEDTKQEQVNKILATINDPVANKEIQQAIALQPYVDTSGTLIEFDAQKAIKDGLPVALVKKVQKDYENANNYLLKQQKTMGATNNFAQKSNQISILAKSSCGGVTKYDGNLLGGTVYLNSCDTNKVIAVIMAGGGATALIGLIPGPGPIIAAIGTAISAVGGAVLAYNNAEGTGVKIKVLRNPFNGNFYPYWVKPQ